MKKEMNQNIIKIAHQLFDDEIDGLIQVKQSIGAEFGVAVEMILACEGKIIVSGMGKSGHVGNKIAATLASTGTSAFFMHPAEALHGDLGMIDSKDLVLAISYSGESDELNAILPIIKHKQVKVISMTGNADSTLARFSDCVLLLKVDKEACPLNLAPTTSTTATLVLGDALAVALLSLRQFRPEDFALSHPGGSLGRKLLTKVSDIMHSGAKIPLVAPDANIKDIVIEISKKSLGMVAVVDHQQLLLGVITDGDLRRVLDNDVDIKTLLATDFMNNTPKTISVNCMAVDAVEIINSNKIGGLVVIDDLNHVVGAFNLHDLFKAKLI